MSEKIDLRELVQVTLTCLDREDSLVNHRTSWALQMNAIGIGMLAVIYGPLQENGLFFYSLSLVTSGFLLYLNAAARQGVLAALDQVHHLISVLLDAHPEIFDRGYPQIAGTQRMKQAYLNYLDRVQKEADPKAKLKRHSPRTYRDMGSKAGPSFMAAAMVVWVFFSLISLFNIISLFSPAKAAIIWFAGLIGQLACGAHCP